MRTLVALVLLLVGGAAGHGLLGGDLPLTAEDVLRNRALGPEDHLLIAVPMRVTAKALTWISLDRCNGLTEAGVAKLRAALPKAQVIDPWRLGIK